MSGDFYTVLGFSGAATLIALAFVAPIVHTTDNARLVKRLAVAACVIAVFTAGCFALGAEKHYREKRQSAPAEKPVQSD